MWISKALYSRFLCCLSCVIKCVFYRRTQFICFLLAGHPPSTNTLSYINGWIDLHVVCGGVLISHVRTTKAIQFFYQNTFDVAVLYQRESDSVLDVLSFMHMWWIGFARVESDSKRRAVFVFDFVDLTLGLIAEWFWLLRSYYSHLHTSWLANFNCSEVPGLSLAAIACHVFLVLCWSAWFFNWVIQLHKVVGLCL